MHEIFISHSSKDRTVADTVCAALEAAGISCWIAPRDIAPGRAWAEGIVDGLSECRVVVLLLSAAANESPEIMREIQAAASKGLTVVPVRIQDVAPAKVLEYYVGPVQWLDAFTPPLEAHRERLAATVREALARTLDRTATSPDAIARTDLARWEAFWARWRFAIATCIASVGVALVASLLAMVAALDFFTLDTKIDTYTMVVGNVFTSHALSPDLALVVVDRNIDRKDWRLAHGAVLRRLARGGARTVALDFFFESASSHDGELGKAVEDARRAGTEVVVGARDMIGRRPRLVPDLEKSVTAWGALCLGHAFGYTWVGPVAVHPANDKPIPSLALAALAAFRGLKVTHVPLAYREVATEDSNTGRVGAIPVSATQRVADIQSKCPITSASEENKEGGIAILVLDLSPPSTLRERTLRHSYTEVLGASDEALARFRGKVVLIGAPRVYISDTWPCVNDRFPDSIAEGPTVSMCAAPRFATTSLRAGTPSWPSRTPTFAPRVIC